MLNIQSLIAIIEVLLVVVPALLTVAFITLAERKTMASMQRRLGPNTTQFSIYFLFGYMFTKYIYIRFKNLFTSNFLIISWIKNLDCLNITIFNIIFNHKYAVFSLVFILLINPNLHLQLLGIFLVMFSTLVWVNYITMYIEKNKLIFFIGAFFCSILLALGFTLIFLDLFIFIFEIIRDIFDLCILWMKWKLTGKRIPGVEDEYFSSENEGSGSGPKGPKEPIFTPEQKKANKEPEEPLFTPEQEEADKEPEEPLFTPEQEEADKEPKEPLFTPEQEEGNEEYFSSENEGSGSGPDGPEPEPILTPEQKKEEQKKANTERKRKSRNAALKRKETETEEEKIARLEKESEQKKTHNAWRKRKLETETEEEKIARLEKESAFKKRWMDNKNETEAEKKQRYAKRFENETPEERKERLASAAIRNRAAKARRKEKETEQQKKERLARENNRRLWTKRKRNEALEAQEN